MQRIHIADRLSVGDGSPLRIIAGPDLIENLEHALKMASALKEICAERDVELIYKSSFDKANRTSVDSARGPGLERGLEILGEVKRQTGLFVTTDLHLPEQAAKLAPVVDLLQIPAFLSRQTDLLVAAGESGRAVNIKKGQFLAAGDMVHAVNKVRSTGNENVMVTERGASFGYHNLVVDFRNLARLREMGMPVCFDATHSVQLPGAGDGKSGGERVFIRHLARAAAAAGTDAIFFEVHDNPDVAPCDGPNQWPLAEFGQLLDEILAIQKCVENFS